MLVFKFIPPFAVAVALGGCANPILYADPEEITLPEAMKSVACSIQTYRSSLDRYKLETGGIIDTVEINFNVKGSATKTTELVVNGETGAIGPLAKLGFALTDKGEIVGERGNTIKMVIKNMYTAQLNKSGEKVVGRDGPPLKRNTFNRPALVSPCEPETSKVYYNGPHPDAINYRRQQ